MRELSLNVLDIVQNSISAKATVIEIELLEHIEKDLLEINIFDNGKGMTEEQVKSVIDPFFTTRTTRKVGLGIPLFKMAAEMSGGWLDIKSEVGKGTRVYTSYGYSNVDRMPVGDMNGTVSMLIRMNPDIDFVYTHSINEKSYVLDTRELREQLDDVPLDTPDVIEWIEEYLKENDAELTT
ncbi:MAG: ATP-binding protein [Acutalibacteraceae bacterium]|nr:sensor histidine kinase [Clostridia bacterium]MEE1126728.1 ATP-binding protein [Acutalibacteraceae bacterium]MBQ2001581.1 sensor histidine kinase [Clostridia bacterium]MBQ2319426.1 sensor histidine kinase [Clostridia bacterium]MBQ2387664.1 sensor histidine kinase [Clostridia bacterium]